MLFQIILIILSLFMIQMKTSYSLDNIHHDVFLNQDI